MLAPYDLRGSRAHVRMLGGIGVLTAARCRSSLDGLEPGGGEVAAGTFPWDLHDEDVHMAMERRLTELVGPVGGKVHTGRSRNDQVALDVQLYLRDAVSGAPRADRSTSWRRCWRAPTARRDVVLPGYTHLQRAQPVLLAHHLLAYVAMLERDAGRLHPLVRVVLDAAGSRGPGGSQLPARPGMVAGSWVSSGWPTTPWTRSPPATRHSSIWPRPPPAP